MRLGIKRNTSIPDTFCEIFSGVLVLECDYFFRGKVCINYVRKELYKRRILGVTRLSYSLFHGKMFV